MGMNMSEISSVERQQQLQQLFEKNGRLLVTEICEHFGISEATARRDLDVLAQNGKIQRFFGGAVLIRKAAPEEPILRRSHDQEDEKERIGRAAAALVNNNETVFLGSGTTVLQVAKNLAGRPLTIITNSLPIINILADDPQVNLIALGGIFRASERSFIGHITEQSLQDLRADKVIIGIHAVSLEHGLTNDYLPETMTDRTILQIGQKVVIVADHTKFGRVSTVHVAPVEKVNTIVTDSQVDGEMVDLLKAKQIEMIVV
jgi:DeoR/GlpR family transcriptional regulator of sugar metabolism